MRYTVGGAKINPGRIGLRDLRVRVPKEMERDLWKVAEMEGISVQDVVNRLYWEKYVKGDFRETYAKAWKYLST